MKRTALKRKTPLKAKTGLKTRSKLKKQSKQPISKIQRKLWELCKQIIRKRHGNHCYTCLADSLSSSNWQTGHMWPKAALGAYMKYDIRVLRPQCFHCNINLGGNGAVFYARMLKEIGPQEMEKLEADRSKIVSAYDHYLMLIDQYTKLLDT